MKNNLLFVLLLTYFLPQATQAQNINSPYSRIGIGELTHSVSSVNQGMGYMGVSNPSYTTINTQNPAMLTFNSYTMFEGSLSLESRTAENTTQKHTMFRGNLNFFAFSFPLIHDRLVSSLGIQPYSKVNYESISYAKIPNNHAYVGYKYVGAGGVSQAYWANGLKISDYLSLGTRINYNFGATKHESLSTLDDGWDGLGVYSVGVVDRLNYSDFTFQASGLVRVPLNDKEKKTYLNLGVTYDFATNLKGTSFRALERKLASGELLAYDTIYADKKFTTSLPQKITLGLSLQKPLHYTVGAEVSMQDWSSYKNSILPDTLGKAMRFSTGVDWLPDATSVTEYFKRVTYRLGFCYNQTPIKVRGEQITDISISAGLSLPMKYVFSTFNLSVVAGQRGTIENGLLKERYWVFNLGATINDRWFVRRRYQ